MRVIPTHVFSVCKLSTLTILLAFPKICFYSSKLILNLLVGVEMRPSKLTTGASRRLCVPNHSSTASLPGPSQRHRRCENKAEKKKQVTTNNCVDRTEWTRSKPRWFVIEWTYGPASPPRRWWSHGKRRYEPALSSTPLSNVPIWNVSDHLQSVDRIQRAASVLEKLPKPRQNSQLQEPNSVANRQT